MDGDAGLIFFLVQPVPSRQITILEAGEELDGSGAGVGGGAGLIFFLVQPSPSRQITILEGGGAGIVAC